MLRITKQLKDLYAYFLYSNDEFSIEYGLERTLTHKPNFDDRREIIGFYSVAILNEGIKAFMENMRKDDNVQRFNKTTKEVEEDIEEVINIVEELVTNEEKAELIKS